MVFLDTNVFLYASGADHPFRRPSQQILERVAHGDLAATTNSEVVQEILFVLNRRGMASAGRELARRTILLFPDLLPVTRADMLTACDLLEQYPALPTRDAIHVATMLNQKIETIVSADGHFEGIRGIQWVTPSAL